MLSTIEREQYLVGHIPYRLQSLRFCYGVCGQNMTPHPEYGTELWIGELLALDDHNHLLINPIIESGLVYSRVLLEFLGIGRDGDTGGLKRTKARATDISITDFGLPLVTLKQAVSDFSYASPKEVELALCHVLETVNKTVAHLTTGPSAPGTFPSLRTTCRVVIDLVCRHLYTPLGEHSLISPISESSTG